MMFGTSILPFSGRENRNVLCDMGPSTADYFDCSIYLGSCAKPDKKEVAAHLALRAATY